VPELIAKTALAGQAPVLRGGTRLEETDLGPITAIALFPGQEKAANKALKPLGFSFPAPNSFAVKDRAMLVWTGRAQAFLIGAEAPDLAGVAAVTDQSGGWAALTLTGPAAAEALMRYVPLDLRLQSFPVGRAVRAPVYHMQAVLMRVSADSLTVLVFRSMARTAWHEIDEALKTLAARAAL
jgi:heterotetrameric sarcosine oxidase gamma subunit